MKCIVCGKETRDYTYRRKSPGGNKYCSYQCKLEYDRIKSKKHFHPINCKICGTLFTPVNSLHKYCSHKCNYAAELLKRSNKPLYKTCIVCKKEFKPYSSLDKFCSTDCRVKNIKSKRKSNWSIGKANNITGTNNPCYRNGNFLRYTKRSFAGIRLFTRNAKEIEQIMIDDKGYIYCQHCNTSNTPRFERHHIVFRSEKPNHSYLHDKCNILITCIKCHNQFHKNKGLRNKIVNERNLQLIFGNDILDK